MYIYDLYGDYGCRIFSCAKAYSFFRVVSFEFSLRCSHYVFFGQDHLQKIVLNIIMIIITICARKELGRLKIKIYNNFLFFFDF